MPNQEEQKKCEKEISEILEKYGMMMEIAQTIVLKPRLISSSVVETNA